MYVVPPYAMAFIIRGLIAVDIFQYFFFFAIFLRLFL
jgi:hypothetical protein